jgi:hypothetical protein
MNAGILRADSAGAAAPEASRFSNAALKALSSGAASDLPPGSLSGCENRHFPTMTQDPGFINNDIGEQARLQARWRAVAAEDARPADK